LINNTATTIFYVPERTAPVLFFLKMSQHCLGYSSGLFDILVFFVPLAGVSSITLLQKFIIERHLGL
jgi:hypothetical protein